MSSGMTLLLLSVVAVSIFVVVVFRHLALHGARTEVASRQADRKDRANRIVVLIPAHNEADCIGLTIEAMLRQDRPADEIVVIPNGCTDDTAEIARRYPVTVLELPKLAHRKSEALNIAWRRYAQSADLVVCLDADTIMPPSTLGQWESEFDHNPDLGGSSSKFTMIQNGLLPRLQKAEFARWTMTSLRRGWTSVLAGTGCAIRNAALRDVVASDGRDGPWSYHSVVEDFELTYQIRSLGWLCQVSSNVRAYTDSMPTVRALWGQRMKWQTGTVEDLLSIGVTKLTLLDWLQQVAGLAAALVRLSWVVFTVIAVTMGTLHFSTFWLLPPLLFIGNDVRQSWYVPHRDWKDLVLAALLIPQELFAWMRAGWFLSAWFEVLVNKSTGRSKDRWALQALAEGR
jgi:poly-beta-1,6-N-acetyl-D-glucosamine synthase